MLSWIQAAIPFALPPNTTRGLVMYFAHELLSVTCDSCGSRAYYEPVARHEGGVLEYSIAVSSKPSESVSVSRQSRCASCFTGRVTLTSYGHLPVRKDK